ncbi:MAG TPA: hypothetical protein VF592_14180 [Sphingomonas sp.]|jgi:hypothetical protein|uniref:hypothetical protein n=1 Tax=Sphingomonas sp. TaxID=28214 RepID=UPI002EDAF14D
MKRSILAVAALFALAACDGAREDAGEQADNAAGVVSSEDAVASGPNETLGEVRDDAAESANEAREARADAMEDAADESRAAADQKADTLEEQAEQARGR